jgi:dTDP-4-dehydrorhamnose 3,5-epimerase
MIFSETRLAGAYTVDIDRRKDDRGYFARTFCADEFSAHGLRPIVSQASVSFNTKRGTLRGLHFQYPPAAETKYVRCMKGAVFDVIVDLRPESPTYLEHLAVVDTELTYLISESHTPNAEGGFRYDDPMLRVDWPLAVRVVSPRDTAWSSICEIEDELKSRMSVGEAAYS